MLENFKGLRLTADVVIRVIADLLLAAVGLALALLLRFAFQLTQTGIGRSLLNEYTDIFWRSIWVLLPLVFLMFTASGLYTRSRSYRGYHKVLMVTQAVTLTYLLFGFVGYLIPSTVNPPRTVLFIAWGLTLAIAVASRLWSFFWKKLAVEEGVRVNNTKVLGNSVLVIGGGGYVGSGLLPKLLKKGYKVRLLDIMMYGLEPIKDVLHHPNFELVTADFRQVDKVVEAVRGVDTVVHLGGLVGDPACAVDENLTIEINLMATKMIAEVAKGLGVSRFVFASTCSVYGASDLLLDEKSTLNPVSLYAKSKIAGEQVLKQLQDDSFSVVNLRFGTIYGLSGRTRFDLVVNLLTAKAVLDKKITVFGGDQWRPFVHVDDASLAVLLAITAPKDRVHNQTFNVGSNEQNMTLGQVGELIQRIVPDAELIDSGMDGDRRNYRVDFAKIRTALGFLPQWTVEKGIRQVIEAFHSGRVKDYRGAMYSNVKYLTEETASEAVRQYYSGWEKDLIENSSNTN